MIIVTSTLKKYSVHCKGELGEMFLLEVFGVHFLFSLAHYSGNKMYWSTAAHDK